MTFHGPGRQDRSYVAALLAIVGRINRTKTVMAFLVMAIGGIASGAWSVGAFTGSMRGDFQNLTARVDKDQVAAQAALVAAQAHGAEMRAVVETRIGRLEAQAADDAQRRAQTAETLGNLQGKMEGVQRSMDYLIGLVQSQSGHVQKQAELEK